MKIKDIEIAIAKISEQLELLKLKLKEKRVLSRRRFIPERREDFFFISTSGEVYDSQSGYTRDFCKSCITLGNCYRTREEAEHYLEQGLLITELTDAIKNPPDWFDVETRRYYHYYAFASKSWTKTYCYSRQPVGLFPSSTSEREADEVFYKFEDRLKYLLPYFGG